MIAEEIIAKSPSSSDDHPISFLLSRTTSNIKLTHLSLGRSAKYINLAAISMRGINVIEST